MTNAETRDYSALSDRELDALVAERVMGWQVTRGWPQGWAPDDCSPTAADVEDLDDLPSWFSERGPVYHSDFADHEVVPHYSSTWDGAGRVLEAMRERGWNWTVHAYTSLVPGSPFEVALENGTTPVGPFEGPWAAGDSLPRAVCIAALRALEAGGE